MSLAIADVHAATADAKEVLVWRRTFPGQPDQVARLRHFVGFLLADLPNVNEIIEVTAELANNALTHSDSRQPNGRITAEIRRWPGSCASVAVTDDGGPNEPTLRDTPEPRDMNDLDVLGEGGRGLPIITAYSTWWGWEGGLGGRTVTAFFLLS
jgi:anti-sigma regulatory factor (Ser/Thr protein kinase)